MAPGRSQTEVMTVLSPAVLAQEVTANRQRWGRGRGLSFSCRRDDRLQGKTSSSKSLSGQNISTVGHDLWRKVAQLTPQRWFTVMSQRRGGDPEAGHLLWSSSETNRGMSEFLSMPACACMRLQTSKTDAWSNDRLTRGWWVSTTQYQVYWCSCLFFFGLKPWGPSRLTTCWRVN